MIDSLVEKSFAHIKKQWKWAFAAALVVGILTHMYVMTNNLMTPDGTWNIYSDQDMLILGRQFLTYACGISSFYNLPWLNGLLAILYISATAVVIVEVFDIKSSVLAALTGGLLCTFPTVASTFCYVFTIDGYMLAMLFSVLAVLITDRHKWGWIVGTVLIGFSLGIYQAYYAMSITLCILLLLKEVLNNKETKQTLLKAGRFTLMGILGYIFYVITLKIMLAVKNVEVTGYQGTDKLLGNPFANVLDGLFVAIRSFASFAVKSNVLTTTVPMTIAYVLLAVIGVSLFIYLFIRNRCHRHWDKVLITVILTLAIPFGVSPAILMEPDVFFHLLMRMAWVLFFVFALVLGEMASDATETNSKKKLLSVYAPTLGTICAAVLVFEFAKTANIVYFTLNERYEKTYGLCLRIVDRLEETQGYKTGDHVALMGGYPDRDYYPETCITWRDLSGYFDPNGEYVVSDAGKLSDFCYHYLNFTIVPATYEEHGVIANSEEYLNMPKFPDRESIKKIDNVWVIKLNG